MAKQINYEAAMKELETIVSEMENGVLDVDVMTKNMKRAKELIALCKDKLTKTEEELSKIE